MLVAALALTFTSCNDDDGYSLDNYWIGMGTVKKISPDSQPFYIQLDNGDKVWIAATNLPYYNPKDGQRIIANYTILSDEHNDYDHAIKLNGVYQVLTKPVIELTTANADSIGNDPLVITDAWIASDHLNIEFEFLGNSKRHMVNLVQSELFPGTLDVAKVQFRQNAYGDEEMYRMRGIVSFNIMSLQMYGRSSRNIELTYTNYDGQTKTITLVYDWSGIININDSYGTKLKEYSTVK